MKRISGIEYLATRDVGMRAEAESVATATLFIAMNPGSLEVMDLTDSGLFERIPILPYPELPPDRPKDREEDLDLAAHQGRCRPAGARGGQPLRQPEGASGRQD